jgi:phenol/toluene 2-monooxygenase (NADH) P1/A1
MQIDIKTSSVEQLRHTFAHVARFLGGDKPASRYQEATIGLQPEVNFHYRPLWQPEFELYDKRRTGVVMKDWYAFKDPRQYYYGAYTIVRSRQQETMEKQLEFVEKYGLLTGLPDEVQAAIAFATVPLRHVEWAANTNNCYITGYGWGTAITQATMFHAMDRLGIAQYLSRIGLILDGNQGDSLLRAKETWLTHPAWQGVRRATENLMVTRDWFELFVAQNLVFDSLLCPLIYQHFDASIAEKHGSGLAMINEFMKTWYAETARWVDATLKTASAESPANAALLSGWAKSWRDGIAEGLQPLAREIFGADAQRISAEVTAALTLRAAKIGVLI